MTTKLRVIDGMKPEKPATKEERRMRMIEEVKAMKPSDLDESFQARRELGENYGYANAHEWWATVQREFDIPDSMRPAWIDQVDKQAPPSQFGKFARIAFACWIGVAMGIAAANGQTETLISEGILLAILAFWNSKKEAK